MFNSNSRYVSLPTLKLSMPDGRQVAYASRRFLPAVPSAGPIAEHTVKQGERLDNITALYLGDAQLFWQLCDVNNAMQPEELTAEPGSKIRISLLQS